MLKRFNVIFDYEKKRMILEPSNHYSDPFHFNMAGIQWDRTAEGDIVIHRLLQDSPAGESGLRKGDQVIRINDRPAAEITMDELSDLFTEEGKEVNLLITREDEECKVTVKLRPLI
ncbi:MAG: PDZ domain-containing protein [Planctomycetota bacterium]